MSHPEPPKSKRVHKPAEQRRSEILREATRIFAERGYQVADMQAVADAAGVGKGTVYRYFPTKEELFTQALTYNLERLKEAVEDARQRPEDPLEQLKEAFRAYLVFFEQNPDLIELFVQERAEFRASFQSSLYFSYMMSGHEEWEAMFQRIQERYPFRAIDIEELMNVCGDLMHGAVVLSHTPLERKPLSQRFDAVFDIYLHGIMAS